MFDYTKRERNKKNNIMAHQSLSYIEAKRNLNKSFVNNAPVPNNKNFPSLRKPESESISQLINKPFTQVIKNKAATQIDANLTKTNELIDQLNQVLGNAPDSHTLVNRVLNTIRLRMNNHKPKSSQHE